tara:strand:- start:1852 stop:2517 length:666 start_codon:yes stop_codon:yes gene_type:complete
MKKHTLFSFRRCPFAIRARWAIKVSGLKVEIREVNLKNKPLELIKNSATKTVPLLILNNGDVLEESLEIMIWAMQNSKEKCLNKYFEQNLQKDIINITKENDEIFKFHLDRFKYSSRYDENKKEFHFSEASKFVEKLNNLLKRSIKSKWLIGGQETIADWSIWPFVRQFKIACDNQKITNYFDEPLNSWFNYFETHENINDVMCKYRFWEETSDLDIFPKN